MSEPEYHYVVNGDGFHLGNVKKVKTDVLSADEAVQLQLPENAHLLTRVIRVPDGSVNLSAPPMPEPEKPTIEPGPMPDPSKMPAPGPMPKEPKTPVEIPH